VGFELESAATASPRQIHSQLAEMAIELIGGEAGFKPAVIDNQAAYVGGWLKQIKEDKKLVITAAGAAQRAADWIRGERIASA
jgi:antirestriction protein ArdC